jgi:tetratricopeptide (TPR) repeat protein
MLAECYRIVGREDRALPLLDQGALLFPKDEELFADRALFFSRVSWLPEARAALQRLDELGAATAHVEMVRIAIARESGDLKSAHRLLAAARERDPADAAVVQQLAAVLNEEGESAAAIRLLEEDPDREGELDNAILLARILAQQAVPAEMPKALAALAHVRAVRPLQPGEELLRARCLRLSGRADEARSLLERLNIRVPTLSGLAFELAQVHRLTGAGSSTADLTALMARHEREQREEAAMRRAVLSLRLHASDPSAHGAVGLLSLQRGLYGRAILELSRAEAMGSRDPKVGDGLRRARREVANAEAPHASEASKAPSLKVRH